MRSSRVECWLVLLLLAASCCDAAFICAQDVSKESSQALNTFVQVKAGELPIIFSAPHGGSLEIPGVPARKGEGLEKGSSGFFTGRDTGTEELAHEVAAAVTQRFGKSPYLVLSRVHRKYLDPNRPSEIAYEDPKVKPIYEHYHGSLAKFCRDVTDRFQTGILIDLHGQGSRRDTVFRGTKNGLTVTHLRENFGELAHQGPQSLFGLLDARGWTVHPKPLDGKEQAGFTGGFIVQTYGSHKASPINAMQLEFGAEYRVESQRLQTAEVLADALADYAEQYLKVPVPPRAVKSPPSQPPIKVAVFVDEGVSSTKQLFDVLISDKQIVAEKISSADICAGKLSAYAVLIHPGGSGSGQGKALGEEGRSQVRDFVKTGRGLVGICAGAYLASCDYEWSLHVLDAKVIDREHWNRGTGTVEIALSSLGRETLELAQDQTEIYYHQGPLLAPADDPAVPDYQPLATYVGEVAKNGAPTGVMPGTTAIALGKFGDGRVLCFSPHPEKTPQLGSILLQGIYWAAQGTPVPSAR